MNPSNKMAKRTVESPRQEDRPSEEERKPEPEPKPEPRRIPPSREGDRVIEGAPPPSETKEEAED